MGEPRPDFGPRGDVGKPFERGGEGKSSDGKGDNRDGKGGKAGANVPWTKRTCTLHLSVSLVLSALTLATIAGACLFIFGVIVGRGHNPEAHIGVLASGKKPVANATQGPDGSLGDAPDKVMSAEDLRFAQTLKGKKGQTTTPSHPVTVQPQQASNPASGQTASPAAGQAASPAPGQVAGQTSTSPPAGGQVFDYTFQVATLNSEDAVDKLRARLEERGLRTRMHKDGKTYRVMVLLRGTESGAAELRQQMLDMKLGQPLQRSKTSVKR